MRLEGLEKFISSSFLASQHPSFPAFEPAFKFCVFAVVKIALPLKSKVYQPPMARMARPQVF
jgi:hypothetical protein